MPSQSSAARFDYAGAQRALFREGLDYLQPDPEPTDIGDGLWKVRVQTRYAPEPCGVRVVKLVGAEWKVIKDRRPKDDAETLDPLGGR